jgi:hypothetical protein
VGRVTSSLTVPGTVERSEAVWYDAVRWPSWVDGFGRVHRMEGDWPGAGSTVVWDSRPGGRGRVLERVVEHAEREGQVLEVEDERLTGVQRVRFEADGEGTRITLSWEYELKDRRLNFPLLDVLFVRRALGESLRRTLVRFAAEMRGEFP